MILNNKIDMWQIIPLLTRLVTWAGMSFVATEATEIVTKMTTPSVVPPQEGVEPSQGFDWKNYAMNLKTNLRRKVIIAMISALLLLVVITILKKFKLQPKEIK